MNNISVGDVPANAVLVSDSQDVAGMLAEFGIDEEYVSLLVITDEAQVTAAWGLTTTTPWLNSRAWRLL